MSYNHIKVNCNRELFMAKDMGKLAQREYENRKRRYRRRRNLIVGLVIAAILVIGAAYLFKVYNADYHNYKVVSSKTMDGKDESWYINYRGGVIKYSRGGAAAVGRNGKILWNSSYEMTDPIADTCDDYAVVADRGGRQMRIFNEGGDVGSVTTRNDIVEAKVASQGVVAVLMQDGKENYIKFYYEDGASKSDDEDDTKLIDMKKSIAKNGNVVSIALSEDGKKLVTDYCSLTTGKIKSYLGCYNFGEVGKNNTDYFMGGTPYEDTVIPNVDFLTNDVFCAFKDNGFVIYSMRETPEQIKNITLKRKIQSILYSERYIGVVLMEEDSKPRQLQLYDLKGKLVLDKSLEFPYKKIYLSGNEIIMYDSTSCLIMRASGKEKLKCKFDSNIQAIFPSEQMDRYFLVTGSEISEIALK
jgi:hypothetical protein